MLAATVTLERAALRQWDAIVVGAGPAGALAARQIARDGLDTLLVDRKAFPRRKVCGACLNDHALDVLGRAGLAHVADRLANGRLAEFRLFSAGRSASIALPGGVAISRARLDAALVEEAILSGVYFLPQTEATLGEIQNSLRHVELRGDTDSRPVAARVVVAADGLGSSFRAHDVRVRPQIAARSRIGAGGVLKTAPAFYHAGTIFMAVARGGYVGLVRVEDGSLNVGAALDARLVKEAGGLAPAIESIISGAGLPAPACIADVAWQGTAPLTRRAPAVAEERLFLVGDAAGYAEPFTGEGMAWAFDSAITAAPLIATAARDWRPELIQQWTAAHRQVVGRRQRSCRLLAAALRHPRWVGGAVRLLHSFPSLARPLVARLNTSAQAGHL